jgi:hypothetical protein
MILILFILNFLNIPFQGEIDILLAEARFLPVMRAINLGPNDPRRYDPWEILGDGCIEGMFVYKVLGLSYSYTPKILELKIEVASIELIKEGKHYLPLQVILGREISEKFTYFVYEWSFAPQELYWSWEAGSEFINLEYKFRNTKYGIGVYLWEYGGIEAGVKYWRIGEALGPEPTLYIDVFTQARLRIK